MYTVSLLQDFSVPLICQCAPGISKVGLDDHAVSPDLLHHKAIAQEALVDCRAHLGKLWLG